MAVVPVVPPSGVSLQIAPFTFLHPAQSDRFLNSLVIISHYPANGDNQIYYDHHAYLVPTNLDMSRLWGNVPCDEGAIGWVKGYVTCRPCWCTSVRGVQGEPVCTECILCKLES